MFCLGCGLQYIGSTFQCWIYKVLLWTGRLNKEWRPALKIFLSSTLTSTLLSVPIHPSWVHGSAVHDAVLEVLISMCNHEKDCQRQVKSAVHGATESQLTLCGKGLRLLPQQH